MEEQKSRLGVKLIVLYTWIGAVLFGLFGLIVTFALIQDPRASGIGVGIIAWFFCFGFAYILGKVANMTSRFESGGWWGQMILSAFGLFSLNPIALIIMIYLWINRKLFGIGVEKE